MQDLIGNTHELKILCSHSSWLPSKLPSKSVIFSTCQQNWGLSSLFRFLGLNENYLTSVRVVKLCKVLLLLHLYTRRIQSYSTDIAKYSRTPI